MNDHPIIYNSEMVRATLDERKTHTRRTRGLEKVNKDPDEWLYSGLNDKGNHLFVAKNWQERDGSITDHTIIIKCLYGQVGDRLWVRENTKTICYGRGDDFGYGEHCIEYIADKTLIKCPEEHDEWWRRNWHVRPSTTIPSIHMPRWVSRITLEITAIRVERVQDISEGDAKAEGVPPYITITPPDWDSAGKEINNGYFPSFKPLWDSINKKRGYGWEVNPWVWVVEFKRIKA